MSAPATSRSGSIITRSATPSGLWSALWPVGSRRSTSANGRSSQPNVLAQTRPPRRRVRPLRELRGERNLRGCPANCNAIDRTFLPLSGFATGHTGRDQALSSRFVAARFDSRISRWLLRFARAGPPDHRPGLPGPADRIQPLRRARCDEAAMGCQSDLCRPNSPRSLRRRPALTPSHRDDPRVRRRQELHLLHHRIR